MAYTQTDLDLLESALTHPEKRIKFQGRELTNRSVLEIQEMITIVKNDLNTATGTQKPRRSLLYNRGGGF